MASPRIALVSGANDGIGFEIAKQLVSQGIKVYIGARTAEKGQAAVAKITTETKSQAVAFVQLEITDAKSIAQAVSVVEKAEGRLDILVNNAGVGHMDKFAQQLVTNLDVSLVRDAMNVNFFGTVEVTQAFIPLLKKSSQPVVVFVSTDMASTTHQAKPGSQHHVVAYNTSKAALNSYAVAVASTFPEWKVNSVTPGYTSTKLNGFSGPKSAADGAAIIVKYAVLDKNGPTGKFFDEHHKELGW